MQQDRLPCPPQQPLPQLLSTVSPCLFPSRGFSHRYFGPLLLPATLVAQRVKCLPVMRDSRVPSLGWEDPLEKEMATHSSVLAWRIPWTEEPGRLQYMGSQTDTTERLHFHFPTPLKGKEIEGRALLDSVTACLDIEQAQQGAATQHAFPDQGSPKTPDVRPRFPSGPSCLLLLKCLQHPSPPPLHLIVCLETWYLWLVQGSV